MNDLNPYASPQSESKATEPSASTKRDRARGPAIPIAIGAMIGGLLGLPLSLDVSGLGFLTVLPGAVLGGLYFRFRSAKWPIDPTARRRRFGFAVLSTALLPTLTAIWTGMRGQGLGMTIFMLLFGASIAAGILVSGDRRSADHVARRGT